jgi:hypothetical protein
MRAKRGSKHPKDDHLTVDVPLTIDIALQIVARERRIPVDDLVGGILETGDIGVSFKGHPGEEDFLVSTLERERRAALADIVRALESNDAITDVFDELSREAIFDILMGRVDPEELHPWITALARAYTRKIGSSDGERFWRLCGKAGLSPGVGPGIEEDVSPSFSLIKDLQDVIIPSLLSDPRAVLAGRDGEAPFFDIDLAAACEILLDQCHIDLEAVASDLLKAMGGVQRYSDIILTVTPDGYVIAEG